MVAKSQIKLITSLAQKKYRQQHGLFVVEGIKGIQELLQSRFKLHSLYVLEEHKTDFPGQKTIEIDQKTLKKVSFLKSPQKALAVFEIPEESKAELPGQGLQLVLDDVRDPGNLGTIIRLCDWFGITHLICSAQTVDCYNPKVVQATMGSLGRVHITYRDLTIFLAEQKLPVYGAFMDGTAIYKEKLPENAVLVLGNEGNGISTEVEKHVQHRISIPQFGSPTAESLNVATAGAILINTFRERGGV
ncbi:TrmH family RNA methyltransferase [Flavimarina sp. Hel_I_48]|uniref:TrmH family RNA methyltransferase n=1 Tax=Flavimarina sp. Hel_I_48 TaxID=1392488 RepID=UPI0004DEDA6A|nr:RNA methyltransferase [Flavimarina sp. Hel_I_48]